MSFVESLPERIQTHVGECGGRLSEGQRQRLGIARVLYKELAVLILDEITSALDLETEARIVGELLRLKSVCTTFFAAHDLDLMSEFDRIIETDSGHLRELSLFRLAA